MPKCRLMTLLDRLGYCPRPAVVEEALEDAGFYEKTELDLSDVWKFLGIFRSREGFTGSEAKELLEIFESCEKKSNGEMSALEAGQAIRWYGYPAPFMVQQQRFA